jgi:hypothetical protein
VKVQTVAADLSTSAGIDRVAEICAAAAGPCTERSMMGDAVKSAEIRMDRVHER